MSGCTTIRYSVTLLYSFEFRLQNNPIFVLHTSLVLQAGRLGRLSPLSCFQRENLSLFALFCVYFQQSFQVAFSLVHFHFQRDNFTFSWCFGTPCRRLGKLFPCGHSSRTFSSLCPCPAALPAGLLDRLLLVPECFKRLKLAWRGQQPLQNHPPGHL